MHGSRWLLIRCFSGKTLRFQSGKGVFCANKPTDLNGILKGRKGMRCRLSAAFLLWPFLSFSVLTVSALDPTFATVIRVDNQMEHEGVACYTLPDGGYLLAGNLLNIAVGTGSFAFCRLNAYGDTLQTRKYGAAAAIWNLQRLLPDNNGWVASGTVDSLGTTSGALWQIDSLGNLVAQQRWSYAGERLRMTSLVACSDGGWLLAGYRQEIGTNRYRFHLRKTDPSAHGLWTRDYPVRLGQLLDAVQTPDSGYLLTGYLLDNGDTSGCMFLMRTDASGDSLWTKKFFGLGWASGNCLQAVGDGCVFGGSTANASVAPADRYLVRCNATGDSLWTVIGGGAADERIHDVLRTDDECLVTTGASGAQLDVTKFDSSGVLIWSHTHAAANSERGRQVFLTGAGNYGITGTSGFNSGSSAFYLLVMDTSGAITVNLVDAFPKPNCLHFNPNPASGSVRFAPGPVRSLVVTDLLGRVWMREAEARSVLDLHLLPPGWYLVEAENESGTHLQGKLIVTE
jgi:hypothetical protein